METENEIRNWCVRNVSAVVIRGFKIIAVESDMSISDVLEDAYRIYVETPVDDGEEDE